MFQNKSIYAGREQYIGYTATIATEEKNASSAAIGRVRRFTDLEPGSCLAQKSLAGGLVLAAERISR